MVFELAVVIGVGIVAALLLYLMNTLDDNKHMIFKLVILFFVMSIILLIPKAAIDSTTVCETVVSNSTEVTASVTSYEYESFCYVRDETTSLSFLTNLQRLYYIFIGYAIVYLAIAAMMKLKDSVKGRKS